MRYRTAAVAPQHWLALSQGGDILRALGALLLNLVCLVSWGACYTAPSTAPNPAVAGYTVGGGYEWLSSIAVPPRFVPAGVIPNPGPYYVLVDTGRSHYCPVDALTYQRQLLQRQQPFECQWRWIRP